MPDPLYHEDREFLAAHTHLIELTDGRDACVAVAPEFQARVMTSTFRGDGGPSFGWINRPFIAAHTDNPQFNNYGGEDRFWLGPEAGQFGLWFQPGDQMTLEDFKTPAGFNSGPFQVTALSPREVTTTRQLAVTNYSGAVFECGVRRTLRLLGSDEAAVGLTAALPAGLCWVAFESINVLENIGPAAWRPESGLVCIWILGMFKPLPRGKVIAPFVPGDELKLGRRVNFYFGDVPADRITIADDYALFTCDGACRTKIGIGPRRAKCAVGSWDPDAAVLTIVTFSLSAAAPRLPYVNSQWELQEDPFGGDVVNSYNDGRDPVTGTVLGPFYELETSSAAAILEPGESLVHTHRTFHLTGPRSALERVVKQALGVDMAVLE